MLRRMLAKTGERIDQAKPNVDARLHDGSRLNAQISPITEKGLQITIRRFKQDIDIETLMRTKRHQRSNGILKYAVKLRMNIMIAGGTAQENDLLNNLASYR